MAPCSLSIPLCLMSQHPALSLWSMPTPVSPGLLKARLWTFKATGAALSLWHVIKVTRCALCPVKRDLTSTYTIASFLFPPFQSFPGNCDAISVNWFQLWYRRRTFVPLPSEERPLLMARRDGFLFYLLFEPVHQVQKCDPAHPVGRGTLSLQQTKQSCALFRLNYRSFKRLFEPGFKRMEISVVSLISCPPLSLR